MTDDFGFEPLDDELGRRLRNAAPLAGDPGDALASLRPRFERARKRRRAVVGTGTALAGIAAAALIVAFITPGSGNDVRTPPATQPHITTTVPTIHTTTPAPGETVPGGTTPGGTTATSGDHGGNRGPGGSGDGGSGSGSDGSGSGSSGSGSSGSDTSGSGSSGSGSSGEGG